MFDFTPIYITLVEAENLVQGCIATSYLHNIQQTTDQTVPHGTKSR